MNNILTPMQRIGTSNNKAKTPIWLFHCECGNQTTGELTAFKRNKKISCGCLKYHHLKKLHIDNTITDFTKDQIVIDYNNQLTRPQIASKHNISVISVNKILKTKQVLIESRRERTIQFKNKFNDLSNKDVLYWIGFIAADGHVGNDGLTIGLGKRDLHHLEKFKNFIEGNEHVKIKQNSNNNAVYINIYSKDIVKSLRNVGLSKNKTNDLTIDERFQNSTDFWRGMFDGDGWVMVDKRNQIVVGLCGTQEVVNSFKKWCSQYVDSKSTVKINGGTISNYCYSLSCNKALAILEILYNEHSSTFLDRKWHKYMEYRKNNANKIYAGIV